MSAPTCTAFERLQQAMLAAADAGLAIVVDGTWEPMPGLAEAAAEVVIDRLASAPAAQRRQGADQ